MKRSAAVPLFWVLCAGAAAQEPISPVLLGDTVRGSHSADGETTAWFHWEAPATGIFTALIEGGGRATCFTGETSETLFPVTRQGSGRPLALPVFEGTTYRIAVETTGAAVTLRHAFQPTPPTFEIPEGVLELPERLPVSYYAWRAPAHGQYLFSTDGPAEITVSAEPLSSLLLERLAGGGGRARQGRSPVPWPAKGGELHIVQVVAEPGGGASRLQVETIPAPPNDDRADAEVLTGPHVDREVVFLGASRGPGDTGFSSGEDASVWYSWQPPDNRLYRFQVGTLERNPSVVYVPGAQPSSPGLTISPTGYQGSAFYLTGARMIKVYVPNNQHDLYFDGVLDPQRLTISPVETGTPPNDEIAHATDLGNGLPSALQGDNIGATGDFSTPLLPAGDPSVWYRWQTPSAGRYRFSVASPDRRDGVFLQVFRGNAEPTVGSHPVFQPFRAEAGDRFWICVKSSFLNRGRFTLTGERIAAPPDAARAPNDGFDDAIEIALGQPVVFDSSLASTRDPDIPYSPEYSRWYRWTAPRDGDFSIWPPLGTTVSAKVFKGASKETLEPHPNPPASTGFFYGANEFITASRGDLFFLALSSPVRDPGARIEFTIRENPERPNLSPDSASDVGDRLNFSLAVAGGHKPSTVERRPFPRLYWEWTAPRTGFVHARTLLPDPRDFRTRPSSVRFGGHQPVRRWPAFSARSPHQIAVEEGTTYQFSVQLWRHASYIPDFEVEFEFFPATPAEERGMPLEEFLGNPSPLFTGDGGIEWSVNPAALRPEFGAPPVITVERSSGGLSGFRTLGRADALPGGQLRYVLPVHGDSATGFYRFRVSDPNMPTIGR